MLRLSETNDKVRVVMDQVGSPTSAGELAKAIACLLPTENYGPAYCRLMARPS